MNDPNQSRKDAFSKLISWTESLEFKGVRKVIVENGFNQLDYLNGGKFRSLADDLDLNLVWMSEYAYFFRKGWLSPSYFKTEELGFVFDFPENELSKESDLDRYYFHPYNILQIANCTGKSKLIRSMLITAWRGVKNRRKHLKLTGEIDKSLFGSFDPIWIKALTELAIVLEVFYRPQIRGITKLRGRADFDSFYQEIRKINNKILEATKIFEKEDWEIFHNYASFIAGGLDKNYELKTLITLMRNEDQDKIHGKLGASLLAREVAQLIRYIASDHQIDLKEEQFCEGPTYMDAYFSIFRGSKEIVDGPRENRLKFVRGFGLDFSIAVRLYVEGETEKYCFLKALGDYGFVEIVDLKGAVWQRGGKGLSFRESLYNDKRSNIYSVLVFDSDQVDLVRIVKDAAKREEFLGQFYLNQPDFELQNFSINELVEIVEIISGADIDVSSLGDIKSAKEFFSKINLLKPSLNRISKGQNWGEALWEYSNKNNRTNPSGLSEDRYINQIVRFCHFAPKMNFAGFAFDHKVDPETGKMIEK